MRSVENLGARRCDNSSGDVVLFFANGLGDHILNLPAIRGARAVYGERLRLVCLRGIAGHFFREFRDLDWLEIDWEQDDSGLLFDVDEVLEFCANAVLLLNLNPWASKSTRRLLERLDGVSSVGFDPAHSTPLPLDYSKHTSRMAFDVIATVAPELRVESFLDPPRWSDEAVESARWIRGGAPGGARVLALHADTGDDKMLPVSVWERVVDVMLAAHPELYVFLVGVRPLQMNCSPYEDRIVPCYGLQLAVSMALVGAVDLFVGIDSSLLHAADFQRVPGVGVFVSTDAHEFGFLVGPHRHVSESDTNAPDLADRIAAGLEDLMGYLGPPGDMETLAVSGGTEL